MREIKFKAYWHESKLMTSVDTIEFLEGGTRVSDGCMHTGWVGKDCELIEYTGLKDKNGIDIYDGNIDQAENGDKNVIVFLLKAGTYCVMPMDIYLNNDYQNEAFSQEFMYGFGYDLFFDNLTPGKYLNIIGNIYENPELLEGNQ